MPARSTQRTRNHRKEVSARLRAMVLAVERWPIPDRLLKVIDELDVLAGQEAAPERR